MHDKKTSARFRQTQEVRITLTGETGMVLHIVPLEVETWAQKYMVRCQDLEIRCLYEFELEKIFT